MQSPEKDVFITKPPSEASSMFSGNAFGGMQNFMFPFSGNIRLSNVLIVQKKMIIIFV